MDITPGERTAQTVRTCFERAQDAAIKAMLPQKAQTVEETLYRGKDLYKTVLVKDAGGAWVRQLEP